MRSSNEFNDRGIQGLVDLMDFLRGPGGCPWDADQTHESLADYLLEETYELLDALSAGDKEFLKEELGDLLLQIVFHARIAEEDPEKGFDLNDVANKLITKLISRHPHVFENQKNLAAAEVKDNWEKLKAKEKNRSSAFEGVSRELPALLFASKILSRLEKYDANFALQPNDSVERLLTEKTTEAELGQILLELVVQGKKLGLEPEIALRKAVLALDSLAKP